MHLDKMQLLCFPKKNAMQLDTEKGIYNYIVNKISRTFNSVSKYSSKSFLHL